MTTSTSVEGKRGEAIACQFLTSRGYQIIAQNFRSRFGEIDLVALEGNCLVFIEVKTRRSNKFGLPEEAVDKRKLKRLIKTASYFKLQNPQTPAQQRIDLVAINFSPNGKVEAIRLLKNISS